MNTQPDAPVAYSEDPNSPFFKMVKQLYDVSQALTTDQRNQAIFWHIPGVTSPGHWLSILQQVLNQTHSRLGKAALSYAVTGVSLSDACISCWQTKYKYNLVRPITYLQTVMALPSWTAVLSTPAHPEYSSAHAVLSSAAADAFSFIFGNSIGNFTDHTYDYLGFRPGVLILLKRLAKMQDIPDCMRVYITCPLSRRACGREERSHQILFQLLAGVRVIKNKDCLTICTIKKPPNGGFFNGRYFVRHLLTRYIHCRLHLSHRLK